MGTWSSIPATGDLLLYADLRHGSSVLASFLSSTASLSKSSDHGQTWAAQSIAALSPATASINSLCYAGGYWFLYAVETAGPNGRYLYRSADLVTWSAGVLVGGGNSSVRQYSIAKGATRFVFVDSSDAGGGVSAPVIKTSTDGLVWSDATFPNHDTSLQTVVYIGASTFIAAGSNGYVYRSTDDGLNWTAVVVGTRNWSRLAYDPVNGKVLLTGTLSGANLEVRSSANAGSTWSTCTLPATYANGYAFVLEYGSGVALLAFTSGATVYALSTTNGGTSWTVETLPGTGLDGAVWDPTLNGFVTNDDANAIYLASFVTVPGQPVITGAAGGDGSVTVSWTAPSDGGSTITGYTITAGGISTTVGGGFTTGTVTGLTNGTAVTVTVTATNGVGSGLPSAQSAAVTPAATGGTAVANTSTLSSLKARALDYADMTGSQFPDDSRLNDYINAGLAELHDLLIRAYREDYFHSVQSITTVPGTEAYALDPSFYKLLRVWRLANGRRYRVPKFTITGLEGYRVGPLRTATIEVWYAPQMTLLTDASDVVSSLLPVGWEDFIALFAAARLKIREEADASALVAEREKIEQRIIGMAEPRDAGEPETMEDASNRWGGGLPEFDKRTMRYRVMGSSIYFVDYEYIGI